MTWIRIFFIIYLFAGYFAAIKFRKNKYFYYLYDLAAVDPLLYFVQKFISTDYYLYCTLASVLILWNVVGLDYKKKILATLGLAITLFHSNPSPLISLIVWETIFLLILFTFLEEFVRELRLQGEANIFLILLSLETLHNSIRVYLYIEKISFLMSFHLWLLSLNILILMLLTIIGPNAKTALSFLNYRRISINKLSNKVLYNTTGNILLNYPVAIDIPNHTCGNESIKNDQGLTRREKEVLSFLSKGLSNKEIANEIFVDKRTVENHLHNIKEKLGYTTMQELRKFATNAD